MQSIKSKAPKKKNLCAYVVKKHPQSNNSQLKTHISTCKKSMTFNNTNLPSFGQRCIIL